MNPTTKATPALRRAQEQPPEERDPTPLETTSAAARKYFAFVGTVSLFINLAMLTVPIYMLQIYDRVLTSRNESTLYLLTAVAVLLLAALGGLEFVRSRVMVRLGRWYDEQLRVWLAHLSITRGRDSQATRDLDDYRTFLTGPGLLALFDVPWTPVFIVAVFLLHPLLGLIAVLGAVVLGALALTNELSTRRVLSEASYHANRANRFSDLVARNSEVIRAMAMSSSLVKIWDSDRKSAVDLQTVGSDRVGSVSALAKFLRLLLQVAILGVGGLAGDCADYFAGGDDCRVDPGGSRHGAGGNRNWFMAYGCHGPRRVRAAKPVFVGGACAGAAYAAPHAERSSRRWNGFRLPLPVVTNRCSMMSI